MKLRLFNWTHLDAFDRTGWASLGLLLLLFALPFFINSFFLGPETKTIYSMRTLTIDTGLSFPRQGTLMSACEQTGIRGYVLARLQFNRSDIKTFVSQRAFDSCTHSTSNDILANIDMFPLIKKQHWPLEANGKFACYGLLRSGEPSYVLIDYRDQEKPTVYVATY